MRTICNCPSRSSAPPATPESKRPASWRATRASGAETGHVGRWEGDTLEARVGPIGPIGAAVCKPSRAWRGRRCRRRDGLRVRPALHACRSLGALALASSRWWRPASRWSISGAFQRRDARSSLLLTGEGDLSGAVSAEVGLAGTAARYAPRSRWRLSLFRSRQTLSLPDRGCVVARAALQRACPDSFHHRRRVSAPPGPPCAHFRGYSSDSRSDFRSPACSPPAHAGDRPRPSAPPAATSRSPSRFHLLPQSAAASSTSQRASRRGAHRRLLHKYAGEAFVQVPGRPTRWACAAWSGPTGSRSRSIARRSHDDNRRHRLDRQPAQGAAGQAIQNLNSMAGLVEHAGSARAASAGRPASPRPSSAPPSPKSKAQSPLFAVQEHTMKIPRLQVRRLLHALPNRDPALVVSETPAAAGRFHAEPRQGLRLRDRRRGAPCPRTPCSAR